MSTAQIQNPRLFAAAALPEMLQGKVNGFDIPIYQRLYAWEQKEIIQLLTDIEQSHRDNERKVYYVGNLTLNHNNTSNRHDIIDGQQRITTLWLIGLVLKIAAGAKYWDDFLCVHGEMSLHFVSRTHDNEFLAGLHKQNSLDVLGKMYGPNVNGRMIAGLKAIRGFIDEYRIKNDIHRFSDYIFRRVVMAAIFLPENINLNKYFEDMNNRGLQLEPHHVLKAALLKSLPADKRLAFGRAWDAVSQMNNYIEYGIEGKTLEEKRKQLKEVPRIVFIGNMGVKNGAGHLHDVVRAAIATQYTEDKTAEYIPADKLTSIVTFPELLLHCLRLFKKGASISLDDKRLVNTFKKHLSESEAQGFIEFIFSARLAFDDKFIKSVNGINGARWEIMAIAETGGQYERKECADGYLVQLQAMLYASTATALWVTQALEYAMSRDFSEKEFISTLEQMDRQIHGKLPKPDELNAGVRINRYWFYKLDLILWKRWQEVDPPQTPGVKDIGSQIRNFQFRDNRSVEHVHPQNPENETWLAPTNDELIRIKDNFGNLALISSSSNSSYQHQTFDNKKADFIKRTNNWGFESLKLLAIYSFSDWSIENMSQHQHEMLEILSTAYKTEYTDT